MAAPMSSEMSTLSLDDYVVDYINSEFTDNIRTIFNAKTLYEETRAKKESLEKKVSLASSEVPSEIKKAIKNAQTISKQIKKVGENQETVRHDILDHLRVHKPMLDDLTVLTQQVEELEQYTKYLSIVAKVEDCSSQLQAALITESMGNAVEVFNSLTALYDSLEESQCKNLVQFTKETILFWNKLLKDKIAAEFEDVLKAMRWPLVASTIKAPIVANATEMKSRMQSLFKQLLQLVLPDTISIETQVSSPALLNIPGLKPLILPLQLMLKPLKKRFKYHFYGKKQTNSLDKPEWYFTQVLSWIRDHTDFLMINIQPLLKEAGHDNLNAKIELMRGLVILVMEKMVNDLPDLVYDEHFFSHMVDEALLFDRELRLTYNYPSTEPGCLHVLSSGDAIDKWLIIEKRFAIQKIEAMLSSPTAWQSQYRDIADVDELKVPECGESFMTLLLTITDRYKPLPDVTSKLRFLGLQLELLEDFRVRVVQVMQQETHNPVGSCFCAILNTVHYVGEVLQEWSETVFFIQLMYQKSTHSQRMKKEKQSKAKGDRPRSLSLNQSADSSKLSEDLDISSLPTLNTTVFDDINDLFESLKVDMLKNSVSYVFTDFQARSQPYRKDRWISLPSHKDLMITLGLSASACEMLLVLKDHLAVMEDLLSKPLFHKFWQRLAEKINKFILDEVILSNHFNEGGAAQLQFDMTRNVFPLFGEFTNKPETYFREVKEACTLLTLKTGSAILLKEVLYSALHEAKKDPNAKSTDPKSALHEVGIYKIPSSLAESILSRRTNLSVR
ncbi:RAD50-interacting protein 1-like [Haliotis rufescens]|uniref:RAD50-interacting protein 1-like n=1 Tax=Haliotis rufescens TaxID=6454 RepID=UPI00201ED340|nr:RAD50-interacting protein 1-like [Haliotis rufescens]